MPLLNGRGNDATVEERTTRTPSMIFILFAQNLKLTKMETSECLFSLTTNVRVAQEFLLCIINRPTFAGLIKIRENNNNYNNNIFVLICILTYHIIIASIMNG